MKKFFTISFLLLFSGAFCQQNISLLTPNQKIIKNAVDSALFIIRQDYVLQSTKHHSLSYGRGNNNFFGRKYAVAVLSGNKLLYDISLEKPWIDDPNYLEYKNIDTLQPKLSTTWIRHVYAKRFVKIAQKDTLTGSIRKDSIYSTIGVGISDSTFLIKGLALNKNDILKEGWLVLVASEANIYNNDTLPLKLIIYREKPVFKVSEKNPMIKTPALDQQILGGIFLSPEYTVGKVEFCLSGIVVKKILNYYIIPLYKGKKKSEKSEKLVPIKP